MIERRKINEAYGCFLQGGVDVGDHPPITPVRSASETEVGGGDAWRLYDYVARHFLGSISPDATFRRTSAKFSCAGEHFSASGAVPLRPGFTAIMPWKVILACWCNANMSELSDVYGWHSRLDR